MNAALLPSSAAARWELSYKIQLICAFFACLLLPFDAIPIDNILVPRASVYPVLAGAALWTASGGFSTLWRGQRTFVLLIALHCLWMTAATLHGLYELRGEQGNFFYPAARCMATLISFWAAPLWFAGLLRRHGNAVAFLGRALTAMFALLAIYGVVDALHLPCLSEAATELPGSDPGSLVQWCVERNAATAFLHDSAPWFRKVAVSDGWWPPTVWWEPRLRSLCGSPPFLAQLLCILLPLFWHRMRQHSAIGAALLLTALAMLAMTKSVSGLATLTALAIIALFYSQAFGSRARLAALCGLFAALVTLFAVHGQDILEKLRDRTGRDRAAVAIMELGIMAEHPFLGAGYRLTGREMEKQITRLPFAPGWENAIWRANQTKSGPLQTAYPALNAYSRMGAESGLMGLALFAAAFFYPARNAMRKPGKTNAEIHMLCCMLLAAAFFWMGEDSHSSFAPYLILGALAAISPLQRNDDEDYDAAFR